MPTYTVLADAYNIIRKSELAGRTEHITYRRGATVELDEEAAAAGVEGGLLAEGEVNPDELEAAKREEEAAAARAAEEEALADARAAEAAAAEGTEEEATTSRRRR